MPGTKTIEKGKAIFISHAVKDKVIISAFVDLLLHGTLGVDLDNIFSVSTDGTKITSGEDWRNEIKASLLSAKITFLIITPNYKESEVCLNEMGAAWVTSAKVIPLIVEPITYKTVGVIEEPKQIEKLLESDSLDRMRDLVTRELNIDPQKVKSDRWTAKKMEFIKKVKKHIETEPFQTPMDRQAFDKLIKDKAELERTIESILQEKQELEDLNADLKKTKDKKEVTEVLAKRKVTTQFQEFLELCKDVTKKLNNYPPIVRGVIFKSYSNKNVDINWSMYKEELDAAYADDIIDEELEANWRTTDEMKDLQHSLNVVSTFLSKARDADFHEQYEEKYRAPLKIGNRKFWEEVFNVSITL